MSRYCRQQPAVNHLQFKMHRTLVLPVTTLREKVTNYFKSDCRLEFVLQRYDLGTGSVSITWSEVWTSNDYEDVVSITLTVVQRFNKLSESSIL